MVLSTRRLAAAVLLLPAAGYLSGCKESTGPQHFVATALSAGTQHTCTLDRGGAAHCWGWNIYGQLGGGAVDMVPHPTPAAVSGSLTFTALTAGGYHTCALTSAGAAWCWGDNTYGQLGNGSDAGSTVPVAVSGSLTFTELSAGGYHTCGLTAGGAVYCWGANGYGELGSGTTSSSTYPERVFGALTAGNVTPMYVSAGLLHTCVVASGGLTYCWGYNDAGQLGNASIQNDSVPVAVTGGVAFTAVSSGGYHTCGLTSGGAVYCWGYGQFGQLGDGSSNSAYYPVQATSP